MNAIKHADGEKERAGESSELGDRTKDVHGNDDENDE
jgi:hypothetical protein